MPINQKLCEHPCLKHFLPRSFRKTKTCLCFKMAAWGGKFKISSQNTPKWTGDKWEQEVISWWLESSNNVYNDNLLLSIRRCNERKRISANCVHCQVHKHKISCFFVIPDNSHCLHCFLRGPFLPFFRDSEAVIMFFKWQKISWTSECCLSVLEGIESSNEDELGFSKSFPSCNESLSPWLSSIKNLTLPHNRTLWIDHRSSRVCN